MQNTELTPTQRQAATIADLEARLQIETEKNFFLSARVRELEAKLGLAAAPLMPTVRPTEVPRDAAGIRYDDPRAAI